MIRKFQLEKQHADLRLDQFLAQMLPDLSRSYLQKLVKSGNLSLNGIIVTVNKTPLPPTGVVVIDIPEINSGDQPEAEDFNFELLYEDSQMCVINKPAGVVVHPAPGNPDGTVVNAILSRYPELRSSQLPDGSRPGIVHRLDKDTSGCLAIARTPEAQYKLCSAFAERETKKTYLALTAGIPALPRGRIENLIGRHPVNRQKMAIVQHNGKNAISEYEVIRQGKLNKLPAALIRIMIFTGRTHQIRVHLASLGCPVLGDDLYGGAKNCPDIPRQMLHAWRLQIPHPTTGEMLKLEAPLPEDFQAAYKKITG